MVELQVDAKLARCGVHHAQALGHDFLANAVTGNDCNAMFRHSNAPEKIATSAYISSAHGTNDLEFT